MKKLILMVLCCCVFVSIICEELSESENINDEFEKKQTGYIRSNRIGEGKYFKKMKSEYQAAHKVLFGSFYIISAFIFTLCFPFIILFIHATFVYGSILLRLFPEFRRFLFRTTDVGSINLTWLGAGKFHFYIITI